MSKMHEQSALRNNAAQAHKMGTGVGQLVLLLARRMSEGEMRS
jgi:hypothetical protein